MSAGNAIIALSCCFKVRFKLPVQNVRLRHLKNNSPRLVSEQREVGRRRVEVPAEVAATREDLEPAP